MSDFTRSVVVGIFVLATSCASSPPDPKEPSPAAPPRPAGGARAALTAEQCEARGGNVVGDIGDGATQRKDYVCPSGAPPSADIVAPAGGPIGVEGSVCCPK